MPAKRLGRLGRLSSGERLIVDRRRRKETQGVAAKRLCVNAFVYGQWERDDRDDGPLIRSVTPLKRHERCLLYRRRRGMSQIEVAHQLALSRWWLNQMERGIQPCDKLIHYWEK